MNAGDFTMRAEKAASRRRVDWSIVYRSPRRSRVGTVKARKQSRSRLGIRRRIERSCWRVARRRLDHSN